MKHCPNWVALTAHRHRADDEEPAGWAEALVHLRHCDPCRERAVAADPTLLFQDLEAIEVRPDEIASMQHVVARVRQLERKWPRSRATRRFLQAAAAVLVVMVAVTYWGERLRAPEEDSSLQARGSWQGPAVALPVPEESPFSAVETSPLPLVEGLGNDEARVYQVAARELDLVVIVDGSLELTEYRLDL